MIFKISGSPALIGRARDNDVVIPGAVPGWESVSRHHALLHYDARRAWWAIRDVGSRNGAYVDGSRTGHNVLRHGTQVQLGSVQAVFRQLTQ
ncbi:MAG TPA: FHA domain-containing protein [Anaerolineae bacterium]|nr:FHA domain-containing protein [Anaerolineae bacterium]